MLRPRCALLGLLLCLAANGCVLRSVRGVPKDCEVRETRVVIEIGKDLRARQTFHSSGVYTRTEGSHKAGDPCEYSLSTESQSAEELLLEAGYTVQGSGSRLSVSDDFSRPTGKRDGPKSIELSVRYEGRILEHNAEQFDEADGTMRWKLLDKDRTSVRFVLEIGSGP